MTGITDTSNDLTNSTTTDNYLETLVGDEKKYANVEELAKAYHHSNLHIQELKDDTAKLNDQHTMLESILDELKGENLTPANQPATPTDQATNTPDVKTLVQAEFEAERQKARVTATRTQSLDNLSKEFDGNMNAGLDFINTLITRNPSLKSVIDEIGNTDSEAFITLIRGYKDSQVVKTVTTNTPGTNDAMPTGAVNDLKLKGAITWSSATDLRKTDPRLYNSIEYRKQLEQAVAAAEAKGVDFFAT